MDAEPVSNLAYCRFLSSVDAPKEIVLEWCGVAADDKRSSQVQIMKHIFSRHWSPTRSTSEQPIMLVSWFGANAYSLWANRQDWRYYRDPLTIPPELESYTKWQGLAPRKEWLSTCLPSEAQWEYAARGAKPSNYPWGDEPATNSKARLARHQAGKTYTPDSIPCAKVNEELGMSPFGIHHMAGNVWQWCRDWYSPTFYSQKESSEKNAQNSKPGDTRSERGGSWVGPEELSSSYYRRGRAPAARGRCLGFRCIGSFEDKP
jgi:formylglycine-generating enzyme required for sulfatase activity